MVIKIFFIFFSLAFVLSILAASKWLLAYVITLFLFPRVKPYVKDIIEGIEEMADKCQEVSDSFILLALSL